jgi:TonB family protein
MEVSGVRITENLKRPVTISVALHALLFLICAFFLAQKAQIVPPRYTIIEVEPALTAEQLKKAAEDFKNKNQVVQTERGKESKVAAPDSFLGERTQTVDRQTVSRSRNTVMEHAGAAPRATTTQTAQKKTEPARQTAERQAVPLPTLGDLAVPILPKNKPETKQQQEQEARNDNWADAGSNPQDYVNGYKESDRTTLNTKEFIFYTYYQRIRSQLDAAWVPILRAKLVKYYYGGRHLASEMEHKTKVLVVLNPRGEITSVKIVSESGTQDLDDAAVSAFNEAGPFPNPPRGIVTSTGIIEIPWEFILRT